MQKEAKIPVLTDLIEKGVEIKLSELGLDADSRNSNDKLAASVEINPALEQEIRRILDEHMELAWQEIRVAIQRVGVESSSE
jgi:hypothetical protein